MQPQLFENYTKKIIDNCSRVIVGKDEVIRQIVVSFLCGGHVLLEDVPGTGKTMLFRAFAKPWAVTLSASSLPRICCPPI